MAGKRNIPDFKDSRALMLIAAERLFAQNGFAATSLREVTTAAGVNLAAVNYYFGSKATLIREVIQRLLIPLNQQRRRNLVSLTGGEQTASVEELLNAYLSPLFDLLAGNSPSVGSPLVGSFPLRGSAPEDMGKRRDILARLYARIVTDPGDEVRAVVTQEGEAVDADYLQSFGRALPQMPSDELAWRFRCITGVVLASFSGKLVPAQFPAASEEAELHVRSWMVAYLAAALRAPP